MKCSVPLAAAVVLATAVCAPTAGHAAARPATAFSVGCETSVPASTTQLDLFASPQVSGRSLLGQLVVSRKTTVAVDAVAGDGYGSFGVPDLTHTWYEIVPTRGLTFRDRWSGSTQLLTQKAWIHRSALMQTAKWTACAATLPFVPPPAVPQV